MEVIVTHYYLSLMTAATQVFAIGGNDQLTKQQQKNTSHLRISLKQYVPEEGSGQNLGNFYNRLVLSRSLARSLACTARHLELHDRNLITSTSALQTGIAVKTSSETSDALSHYVGLCQTSASDGEARDHCTVTAAMLTHLWREMKLASNTSPPNH